VFVSDQSFQASLMFSSKAGAYPSRICACALTKFSHLKVAKKSLFVTNTLAYLSSPSLENKKRFVRLTRGDCNVIS
jgi:hypothetical protein